MEQLCCRTLTSAYLIRAKRRSPHERTFVCSFCSHSLSVSLPAVADFGFGWDQSVACLGRDAACKCCLSLSLLLQNVLTNHILRASVPFVHLSCSFGDITKARNRTLPSNFCNRKYIQIIGPLMGANKARCWPFKILADAPRYDAVAKVAPKIKMQ